MPTLSQGALSLRLALVYAAVFVVMGTTLPYWPLFLAGKGLTAQQIGWLLATAFLVKVITNPLLGQIADRLGERKRPLLLLAVLAALFSLLYQPVDSFAAIVLVTALNAACFTALLPLTDNLTMMGAASHGLDYGRVRLWGSLSFIAAATLGGLLLVDAPRWWIWASATAGHLLVIVALLGLPDWRQPPAPKRAGQSPWGMLRLPRYRLFLAVTSLTQLSHMIYYGFATLYWKQQGLSGHLIGGLWAEGVIAEVLLFIIGQRLIRRFGPEVLLLSAGVAGLIRWTVLGLTTDPLALIAVQGLHAFTFGANHLGAMHFVSRIAPPGQSGRAQGLYSSITNGLVPGLGLLGGGALYQALQGAAFLPMAVLSLLGLGLGWRLLRKECDTNQHK